MREAARFGLFGGSFDPVHRGHVEIAEAARRELRLDRVLFLPTSDPPHKRPRWATALQRYCMVELALLDHPALEVSTHELTPGRRAFTVDTVQHFRRELPGASLFLLIGADSFLELDQWRRFEELVAEVELVVLARPGYEAAVDQAPPRLAAALGGRPLHRIDRRVDVSSTELRRRLAAGELPGPEVLPSPVLQFIRKYSLYR
ncbi:MAG TPA: nicotinate-nucleotide adenylyltransferase [Thermoanaerobaculia bacterium]|nr:nicotinate-nucleotide adenylyltransferase [Thermoanaerobaculia bacterium]